MANFERTNGYERNEDVPEHDATEILAQERYLQVLNAADRAKIYEPTTVEISDDKLRHFRHLLWENSARLDLADHIKMPADRTKLPRRIKEYGLVPVLPPSASMLKDTLAPVGTSVITLKEATFEYKRPGGAPSMDARIGLGLTYQNRVVAACAGGLATEGLMITQLQDVSSKLVPEGTSEEMQRKFRFASGLHGGVDWKHTLITAWTSLMQQTIPEVFSNEIYDVPTWIRGAKNNRWAYDDRLLSHEGDLIPAKKLNQEAFARLFRIYDITALKLYAEPCDNGNYVLPQEYNIHSR